MAVDVFICFNGNCREAVNFYSEVFGSEKANFMTYKDAPPNTSCPPDEKTNDLVMYTDLKINGSTVMFSDVTPGMPFIQGNNITLTISSANVDEIKSVFNKLKEGGKVHMELQETFWSKCFGMFTDKFGVNWQVSQMSEEQNCTNG